MIWNSIIFYVILELTQPQRRIPMRLEESLQSTKYTDVCIWKIYLQIKVQIDFGIYAPCIHVKSILLQSLDPLKRKRVPARVSKQYSKRIM